jgi:hypothetical protein
MLDPEGRRMAVMCAGTRCTQESVAELGMMLREQAIKMLVQISGRRFIHDQN